MFVRIGTAVLNTDKIAYVAFYREGAEAVVHFDMQHGVFNHAREFFYDDDARKLDVVMSALEQTFAFPKAQSR